MKRDFKFRHVDEIAGTFVICAIALFVLGVVLAGRSQGWFEGEFTLNVVFKTSEGSFGLQEGAVVQVRNTVAGRVGKIMPTEGGMMGTTFVLKESFHPFVTEDSVAKVKKKFGVAGDSYVEIGRGSGAVVEDGGVIECAKDEELMEKAQLLLEELETSLVPMFEDFEKIVASVASILASVEEGEGVAGAVVKDSEMRDDLIELVAHLEGVAVEAESLVAQAGALLSNDVSQIVGDATVVADRAKVLMQDDVTRIAGNMHGIQSELSRTLREGRRLIVGVQRHWLLRKYVKQDSETVPLVPAALCELGDAELIQELANALTAARASDDAPAIARNAYNLAVCGLATGDVAAAERLNTEARVAYRTSGESASSTYLLEAELSRLVGEYDTAVSLVEKALDVLPGGGDKETKVEAQILLATIHIDATRFDEAADALDRATRLNRRLELPPYAAAICGLRARIGLELGAQDAAAVAFAEQAEQLRKAGALGSMANALRQAGDAYTNIGQHAAAAEYYYRGASSLIAQKDVARAREMLELAQSAAEAAGDALIIKRVDQLQHNVQ
jgi:phospholipid/cholesterol/gamma-HCH transport system substrate-binding protein